MNNVIALGYQLLSDEDLQSLAKSIEDEIDCTEQELRSFEVIIKAIYDEQDRRKSIATSEYKQYVYKGEKNEFLGM